MRGASESNHVPRHYLLAQDSEDIGSVVVSWKRHLAIVPRVLRYDGNNHGAFLGTTKLGTGTHFRENVFMCVGASTGPDNCLKVQMLAKSEYITKWRDSLL